MITDSILTSVKKLLGITEECTDFDADLILHINSVLMILTQIGVGPSEGFSIKDKEWLSIRDEVIVRDQGCDLGIEEYELSKGQRILIHHMNPLTKEDIVRRTKFLLDPEYLITTCHRTHTAIHYGDENLLPSKPIVRTKNDTCPWRR